MANSDVTLSTALKEILPLPDSLGNDHMSDVIGNKDDTIAGDSIMALLKRAAGRLNNPSRVYPSLADGIDVISGAGAWALGGAVEILPAGAVSEAFLVFYVKIEAVSLTDVYEIILYSGALADVEVGRFRTQRDAAFPQAGGVPISTEIIPADTRLSARIANQTAPVATLTVSIHYIGLE